MPSLTNPNMLSGFSLLQSLAGDEYVEVVKRTADGTFKNYRILSNKLRTGASAYDSAVATGFVGTEAEWVATLPGKSAFQLAVDSGLFIGTEAQWTELFRGLYVADVANAGKVFTADVEGIGSWKVVDRSVVQLDTAESATYVGPVGSFSYDELLKLVYIHDGVTAGGKLVSGLDEAAVDALIAARKVTIEVANFAALPVVGDALADTFYYTLDTEGLYLKVAGAYVHVNADSTVVKGVDGDIDLGIDDAKYVTAKQLHDFLTEKLGAVRAGNGTWTIAASTIAP
jgi:hypothetical protein